MRFHLFPFRTEKLSSLTPMVLRSSRGRVGSRLFKPIHYGLAFLLYLYSYCIIAVVTLILRLKEAAVPHLLCYPPPKFPLTSSSSLRLGKVQTSLPSALAPHRRSCEGDFVFFAQNLLHSIQKSREVRCYKYKNRAVIV